MLVSEVMLQQTPVSRVLPAYESWLARWPTPASLAEDSPGEAVRAWGRLGYPRRALRLHAAATTIVASHAGAVPEDLAALRALPGVGDYTAAAVAAFAYRQRVAVLDTNVRRVLARLERGSATAPAHLSRAERDLAERLLPPDPATAARWSVAVMELGALVCTATAPRCGACPLADRCAWLAAGRPAPAVARRAQPFTGTDRQVRGLLLAAVREATAAVPAEALVSLWPDDVQRDRALASLLADGLLERVEDGRLRLPS